MAIIDDLNTLQTNIVTVKQVLADNINTKGVSTVTSANTLTQLANAVNDITVGEGGGSSGDNPFSAIGYTSTPKYIQDSIDYAQTIYDNWDINKTNISSFFNGDEKLVYFPSIDTSNVTNMSNVCNNTMNLQYVPKLNIDNVTNLNRAFYGSLYDTIDNLRFIDVSNWNTSNVTDMSYAFGKRFVLQSLDVSNWNTSKVTNISHIFENCQSIESLDVSNWNTSNVTDMSYVFSGCKKITSLDVSNWNTSKVTNMNYMFYKCSGLTSLDVSNFDTSNTSSMYYMFDYCSNLTSLDLSNWNTSNVTNMDGMFSGCTSIQNINITNWNTSKVTSMNNMFKNCTNLIYIEGMLDLKNIKLTNNDKLFGSTKLNNLIKVKLKNIGYINTQTVAYLPYLTNWGVNNDTITDARQSLIDSLITYSYDRATAGYSTYTIHLSTNTKALLTEDEIAQITAKGFTIA